MRQKRWAGFGAVIWRSTLTVYPSKADAVRIKLAQICVLELQRPGKALDLLRRDRLTKSLPEKQAKVVKTNSSEGDRDAARRRRRIGH